MGTKLNPLPFDCYAAALPDEPMFVLLARDVAAPAAIEDWADLRGKMVRHGEKPATDWPMISEARMCATLMREWRRAEWPAARDRRDDAQIAPLADRVGVLLYAFKEGLNDQAHEAMEKRDFQAVYKLLEEALETGARTQRGDYG